MICPHGNYADDIDPALLCAQCEVDAERRAAHLDAIQRTAEAAVIDLRTSQPTLPDELLPRPAGTLL